MIALPESLDMDPGLANFENRLSWKAHNNAEGVRL
jgi:hypothetical protein